MANVLTLTSPLMRRSVGFDRFNDLFESLLEDKTEGFDSYPPYNIEKLDDDHYQIVMAVAGFSEKDIDIILENGELCISSQKNETQENQNKQYLHRGIATRSFKRSFRLADFIKVVDATMKDGLLIVDLVREVPEEKKPRSIPIGTSSKLLGNKKKK